MNEPIKYLDWIEGGHTTRAVPRRREELCAFGFPASKRTNQEGERIDFPRSIMYLIWGTVLPGPEALCSIWDKPHLEPAESTASPATYHPPMASVLLQPSRLYKFFPSLPPPPFL